MAKNTGTPKTEAAAVPAPIVTTELVIVDPQGRPCIRLTGTNPDGPSITLIDINGQNRLVLDLGQAGAPSISLFDQGGHQRVNLHIDEVSVGDPSPSIFMTGPSPQCEAAISIGVGDHGANIDLYDGDGDECIGLAVRNGQACVRLNAEVGR
ncbi:MAG TPA: hypothetical protein VGO93_00575 [Candidatus Xenobia bacterium]|jgi:hypothetical protein